MTKTPRSPHFRLALAVLIIAPLFRCANSDHRDGSDQVLRAPSPSPVIAPVDTAGLSARIAGIEAAIEETRRRLNVPGAAVAIVLADRPILLRGFGERNTSGEPVTPSTLFSIGSCTKPFTALAAAISADRGLLSLDDSPRKFLPYFALSDAEADRQVTIRDLLSHRTGVPDDLPAGWFERYPTHEALIRAAMRSAPTARIRERWQYNNYMYLAAGEALAAAHRRTFEHVMSELILDPLRMRSSNLSIPAMARSHDFSFGFSPDSQRRQLPMDTLAYLSGIAPAGGINSNAEDMAQWLRLMLAAGMLDGRRLVSESGFRTLLTTAVTTPAGKRYGLGWFIEDWHSYQLVNHPGGVIGFATRCDLLPERGLGWVVLTNVDDLAFSNAVREIVYQHLLGQ